MSVYRRHKEKNFTCIDNYLFEDKTLSMKAKGLLAQILSLPEDWKYSVNGLASLFSDGRDAVNGAINELIEHGYIIRSKSINSLGMFEGYVYDIYEKPQTENGKVADIPFTDNPNTDNPFTENQEQLNTNILNTNVLNTNSMDIPPIIPREVAELDSMFEQFWKAYPKKVNKKNALREFKKKKDIEVLMPTILADLEYKKRSKQWNEDNGQYIPYPERYIKNERWNDVNEVAEKQTAIEDAVSDDIRGFL